MFRDLVSYKVDHSPFQFGTLFGNSAAVVHIADSTVRRYDVPTFITEMDTLAGAIHPSIVRVRAICLSRSALSLAAAKVSAPNSPAATAPAAEDFYFDGARHVAVPLLACVRDPIEAQPLTNVLSADRRKWTIERVLTAAIQLAEAIAELHLSDIVLRDHLSPQFLLITPVGDVRVADLPLSRYAIDPPPPPQSVRYCAPEHLKPLPSATTGTHARPKRRVKKRVPTAAAVPAATATAAASGAPAQAPPPLNVSNETKSSATAITLRSGSGSTSSSSSSTSSSSDTPTTPSGAVAAGSTQGDIYAFGCVLYAVAAGHHPWAELQEDSIVRTHMLKGEHPPQPADMNAEMYELIKQCCRLNPSERPSLYDVISKLRALLIAASRAAAATSAALPPLQMPFGLFNVGRQSTPASPSFASADASQLRQKLQPLSSDSVTAAREKWLSAMGTVDPYIIVAKRVDAPSFYVVHRPNGNAVFVSCGLWDPSAAPASADGDAAAGDAALPDTEGTCDIELVGEAKESELGGDLSNCWLYQCLLEVIVGC
jgi:serine/threonine protein kinase